MEHTDDLPTAPATTASALNYRLHSTATGQFWWVSSRLEGMDLLVDANRWSAFAGGGLVTLQERVGDKWVEAR